MFEKLTCLVNVSKVILSLGLMGLMSFPACLSANESSQDSHLADRGITPYAALTAEVFSNLSGGNETGTSVFGVLELGLDMDLDRLAGWQGTSFHVSGLWAGGEDPSVNVGDFNTLSNIAAPDSVFFYEAWLETYFLDEKIRFKLGQIAVDSDFMGSEYGGVFINSAFGMLPTFSGNTAVSTYPLGALGALIQYALTDTAYIQLGVYDGDAGADDEHGVDYDFGSEEGVAIVYEIGSSALAPGGLNGDYKLGGLYHTGEFADFRDGSMEDDNYNFYVVVDQPLINQASGEPKLAAFLRASYSPQEERNTVNYYIEAGINLFSPFAGRDADIFGIGFFHTDFSGDAVRDLQLTEAHVNDSEQVLEIFYQAEATPWLVVKPDIQFIFDPMLGENDAIVFGTRFEIAY
jgi:porin